jgi:hypothetical protein
MVRSLSRLCAALLVAGMVLAGTRGAGAFQITQPIPNSDLTACLDVKGSATAIGTAVETYPCNGGFNEQWALGALINGPPFVSFEVYNSTGSAARCLSTAATASIGGVVLGDCGVSWDVYGSGELLDASAGGCLDSQGNYGSGAQAVVGACSVAPSQYWELKNIVIVQTIPGTSDSACVNVRNKSIANGTPVDAYPCTMGVNTRFSYTHYQLQGVVTNTVSTCLGESASGTVELQTCNGSHTQAWYLQSVTNGTQAGITIANANSSNCLDSQGNYGSTAQLADTPCGPASQLWKLH